MAEHPAPTQPHTPQLHRGYDWQGTAHIPLSTREVNRAARLQSVNIGWVHIDPLNVTCLRCSYPYSEVADLPCAPQAHLTEAA